MKEFCYRILHTEYSCTGSISKARSKNACFSYVFRHLGNGRQSVSYKIYIYKGMDFFRKEAANNSCFISKKELRHHLDQLKKIIPFKATIREVIENDCPCYRIDLTVEDALAIQHKYILSWIRYTYEYPYCVILQEALRLRKEPEFRFESCFNLFNLIGDAFGLLGGGHSIAYGSDIGFLRRKELEAVIKKKRKLNSIFECGGYPKSLLEGSRIKRRLTPVDLEFWTDNELFMRERKPVYLELYKKKKIKDKNK